MKNRIERLRWARTGFDLDRANKRISITRWREGIDPIVRSRPTIEHVTIEFLDIDPSQDSKE
ncbi:hypothetical protein GZH49_06345 [Nocardia terpenica]|uniref:hypothetical protein n=1 Tax=Nocardia terpenica TaxID=455432 RepID=UPI002FE03034